MRRSNISAAEALEHRRNALRAAHAAKQGAVRSVETAVAELQAQAEALARDIATEEGLIPKNPAEAAVVRSRIAALRIRHVNAAASAAALKKPLEEVRTAEAEARERLASVERALARHEEREQRSLNPLQLAHR